MATIRRATLLKKNSDGYVNALLTVTETERDLPIKSDKHSLKIKDTKPVECIELSFKCETTGECPMAINSLIFGLTVKPETDGSKRVGTKMVPIYNKLTNVLLALGIITKDDLAMARKDINTIDTDLIMAEFYAIKDKPVRFIPVTNKNGFHEPNLLTLELIPE